MPNTEDIKLTWDEETKHWAIVWDPVAATFGKTQEEALEMLRDACHLTVDSLIDLKLEQVKKL